MLRIEVRCTWAGVLQAAVISIDVQAGDLDQARQQGARPKRILVGHSLGGACAVAEVIDHPEVCSHVHPQEPVKHKMQALTDPDSAAAWLIRLHLCNCSSVRVYMYVIVCRELFHCTTENNSCMQGLAMHGSHHVQGKDIQVH